jgi:hypothetical protein
MSVSGTCVADDENHALQYLWVMERSEGRKKEFRRLIMMESGAREVTQAK